MANTVMRTGRSGVLNRARDFSCCIVTRDCQLLVAAESLPVHVMGADLLVRALHELHPDVRPGDAFLHNSPYHGNTHAADHVVLVPVFDGDGEHRYTAVCKAHQADTGNSIPSTYHGTARDVYEEGALIFPCVRVHEAYRDVEDVVRMCKLRIRVPEQWYGDYLAMIGGARIGERELQLLGEAVGWEALHAFDEQWLDYSERRMAAAIAELPPSETTGVSIHDPIPGTPPEGIVIKASVRVLPDQALIEVDLRDNPDNLPCGLNQTEATARSAALTGVFNSLDPSIPKNGGSARCVRIRLREGCVAGIPRHPASCSVATTNVADRILNATQQAMAQIGQGVGMAEFGAFHTASMGVVSGIDPRTGGRHINQVFLGATTGAGNPWNDAWLTYCHGGNGAMSNIDAVELAEAYEPLVVWTRRIVADTEGAGWRRGAPSLEVDYGPVEGELTVAFTCDGRVNVPKGVRGGGDGGPASVRLRRASGAVVELPASAVVTVGAGERIVSITHPGGGYGPPHEREPERVLDDVREGWVSRERARDVYGVAVSATGELDREETARLRAGPAPAGLEPPRGAGRP
jgi:N-methylhydantoinase B